MIFEIIVYTTSSIKQNKVDIFICGHILLNCLNDSLHPYFLRSVYLLVPKFIPFSV